MMGTSTVSSGVDHTRYDSRAVTATGGCLFSAAHLRALEGVLAQAC